MNFSAPDILAELYKHATFCWQGKRFFSTTSVKLLRFAEI